MEKWIRERLSVCLAFEIPDDMIKYILALKDSQEFDEYFETLLNKDCDDHRLFLADCKQRLFKTQPQKKSQFNQTQQKKMQGIGAGSIKQNTSASTEPLNSGGFAKAVPKDNKQQQGAKKKSKYVSLYTQDGNVDGETILLKGRRVCECQASQHKLINNCLGCGRVVCEQEGSGPCLFCGEIVCTNEEQQLLKAANKKSENLMKALKEKGGGESLKKAMEQRDRLLEYDRNSEKRTTVIDDEHDYFQEGSVWLSDAERTKLEHIKQEMHEKKHASRANRKIKVDFAGREVDDDLPISAEYERKVLKEIADSSTNDVNKWSNRKSEPNINNTDPNLDSNFAHPLYQETSRPNTPNPNKETNSHEGLETAYNRVQDKEFLEMQDMRHCLSMHQPWASLLVAGIKKHEGRVWYTEHRGRLWIASTAKEPRTEDIQEIENFYKTYYNDANIKFPENYPTGCLLGCVKMNDCISQEEYREIYPNGESESPYVFVCSNPEELPVVFPIKGQQKIYQIDPQIHNAACKTLLRLRAPKQTVISN